jgi:hypothetical protein
MDFKAMKKERIIFGLLVCILGSLWLLQELKFINEEIPFGPLIAILIGFVFFLPWIK